MDTERIADGQAVTVSGYHDPETDEPIERRGVVVSGGHVIDDVEHYEVHLDETSYPGLIAADRVTPAA